MCSRICCVFTTFSLLDYKTSFTWIDKNDESTEIEYTMPALIGPHEGEFIDKGQFEPLVEVPAMINAKKLNTVIWSIGAGIVLYALNQTYF